MYCKFLQHGLAISYDNLVKPCCAFTLNKNNSPNVYEYDISKYHTDEYIRSLTQSLATNQWPNECKRCRVNEEQGKSSMRENANQAYRSYNPNDITLEIRPGNVCNFACQTCWPAASSRVTAFYQQAGFDVKNPVTGPGVDTTKNIINYSFLDSIKHRVRDVILLGGEPFYDKNCLAFLQWAIQNLSANITLFSNTSIIKEDLIQSYKGTFTIVSSIDAVGKPAEYIRFGTEWDIIETNYKRLKQFGNIKNRVNITTSAYNYYYISDVIDFLIDDWPEVVSFGVADDPKFKEWVVPLSMRASIIERLEQSITKIERANIVLDQKQNAVMNCQSIIKNLQENPYNKEQHTVLKQFSKKLDEVKKINSADYGDYLKQLLND